MSLTVEVETFDDVDLAKFALPIFTVYERPSDFPEHYVVRLFDLEGPTEFVTLSATLEAARFTLPPGKYCVAPQFEDDPKIVEVWL